MCRKDQSLSAFEKWLGVGVSTEWRGHRETLWPSGWAGNGLGSRGFLWGRCKHSHSEYISLEDRADRIYSQTVRQGTDKGTEEDTKAFALPKCWEMRQRTFWKEQAGGNILVLNMKFKWQKRKQSRDWGSWEGCSKWNQSSVRSPWRCSEARSSLTALPFSTSYYTLFADNFTFICVII